MRRNPAPRTWVHATVLLLLGSVVVVNATADTLDPKTEWRVRAATFEFVLPKPQTDSLTYDRPLPNELIPYSVRNDKYQPIGTAFALDGGRYVTAAHVLTSAINLRQGIPLIRGRDGDVHQIGDIVQLSLAQDYAIFTVRDKLATRPLDTNSSPVVGGTVHAVGDALGEGIVVRDGLLTSQTPEDRNGAWKWLRFSAAASPGNSGGPLLDAHGQVIGVVLAKSPNENLNYALPIDKVLHPATASVARLEIQQSFGVAISSKPIVVHLDRTIALPLTYELFSKSYTTAMNEFFDESLSRFQAQRAGDLFPQGASSEDLLTKANWAITLELVSEQTNGQWDVAAPTGTQTVQLPPDGELETGISAGVSVMRLIKPSAVPLNTLFADSKAFMDLVLKGFVLSRNVADQAVRITSLGRATTDRWYSDHYGRRWQLRVWTLEFSGAVVVTLALPKPDGADVLVQLVPAGLEHAARNGLEFLADYAYTGYYGSLADWKAYLALPNVLPRAFKDIKIDIDVGKRVRFSSHRFQLDLDDWIENIDADSRLDLQFAYFKDGGRVVWDVATLLVAEDRTERTYISIARRSKPAADSSPEKVAQWKDLIARKGDYSGFPVYKPPTSTITRVLTPVPANDGPHGATPTFVYTAAFRVTQYAAPQTMSENIDRISKEVTLKE